MLQYTLEEFATLLTKAFSRYRPRVIYDTTDKGEDLMEFLIPHPTEPRFSLSLQARGRYHKLDNCTLWFGQAEIKGKLDPDMAIPAITTIINGDVVAIVQYKNTDAYDNCRPKDKAQWLYQLTDDEDDDSEALRVMKQRLASPPSLLDKLTGKYVGIFEIYSWVENEMIRR